MNDDSHMMEHDTAMKMSNTVNLPNNAEGAQPVARVMLFRFHLVKE